MHGDGGMGMGWMNLWWIFGVVVVIGVLWLVFTWRRTGPQRETEEEVPARYEMATSVKGALAEVKTQVVDALKAQGFGVLTEIDVQKTLKDKLGAEMEPYIILGACNPQLARQALDEDRSIGLLLPCNVVLRQEDGDVRVSILDPRTMFEVVDTQTQANLAGLPEEARTRLRNALQTLGGG